MFFRRSAGSLKRILRKHPEWRTPVERVLNVVREVPAGGLIDPVIVSHVTAMSRAETLAFLNVLRDAGLGDFVIRVIDEDGSEVARYPSIRDIPPRVEDQFGDVITVMPENIDISFEPRRQRLKKEALGPATPPA